MALQDGVAWNGLGEYAASKLRKGDHIYVEGTLVSSTYEKDFGKGKTTVTVPLKSWQVKADSIRKLNRVRKDQAANPCHPMRSRRRFRSNDCFLKRGLVRGPFSFSLATCHATVKCCAPSDSLSPCKSRIQNDQEAKDNEGAPSTKVVPKYYRINNI
jgi:single-stranded DNA-binding protein